MVNETVRYLIHGNGISLPFGSKTYDDEAAMLRFENLSKALGGLRLSKIINGRAFTLLPVDTGPKIYRKRH